jgi:hypothetical protein
MDLNAPIMYPKIGGFVGANLVVAPISFPQKNDRGLGPQSLQNTHQPANNRIPSSKWIFGDAFAGRILAAEKIRSIA